MEALRNQLAKLSSSIPPIPPPSTRTRLATLSQTHLAVLHPSPPTLQLHPLSPSHKSSTHPISDDANALLPTNDMLAITGSRSITILHSPAQPRLQPVAEALFRSRPSLKLLHAAWSPHANAFLAILTSDACLRLFDVVTPKTAATERWRLPLVTAGAAPVSFAFGRGSDWHSLSLYVLCEDGAIYVCAPVAPIGTTLSTTSWRRMRQSAKTLLRTNTGFDTVRKINFDNEMSWEARQAAMQLRFLDAFETIGDRMICVREFKPAPLLVQGPVYVEHDDVAEDVKYVSLTLLVCGAAPPVLLRASENGDVTVLVALERAEPQWFLSTDSESNGGTDYGETARTVAPAVLAFEHLSFDSPVSLFPLGGSPDADVFFAATETGVYAVRLSFISVINNPDALERTPHTTISQMLTTSSGDGQGLQIHGLTPSYARNEGPVAIALTSDGSLHCTSSVRWVADFDLTLPPRLLSRPQSDSIWNTQRPQRGSRAYACADAGKEVTDLLHAVATMQGKYCARVAPGTLGEAQENEKLLSAVSFLEGRVEAFTGSSASAGIGDSLSNLASAVTQWRDELEEHAASNAEEIIDIKDVLEQVQDSENALKLKLKRVEELANLLAERMRTLMETIQSDSSKLTPAETERLKRLKEKKRRMVALRCQVDEVAVAIKTRQEAIAEAPATGFYSPIRSARRTSTRSPATTPRRSSRWSSSPLRSQDEPLARRRPEWSARNDRVGLSRTELQQIKASLETHSREISEAMEKSASLWKRLSAV